MNLQQAIDILRVHNRWRRYNGDDGPSAPNPSDVGIAIDIIVSHFDGGLHVGEYKLADDCTCHIANRTVIVTEKVSRGIRPGDYRCRDCKNQIVGRSTCTAWYDTKVCSLKPKKMNGSRQLYYCAPDTRKPCEMFELKSK